jgi:hypothetical protein
MRQIASLSKCGNLGLQGARSLQRSSFVVVFQIRRCSLELVRVRGVFVLEDTLPRLGVAGVSRVVDWVALAGGVT